VHEFVEGTLKGEGVRVKPCDIPIHHYGRLDEDKIAAKGEAYYQMGKRKIEEARDKTKALHELAVQAGELGKYEDAVELWLRVIRRAPDRLLAHFNLGYAYLQLGRFEESLDACKKAMALDPEHKEVVLNYANCELFVGDVKKGVAALEKMLKKNPNYPAAVGILAALYYVDGRETESLNYFNELRKKGFNCAEFLHKFARNLMSVKRWGHALRILKVSVESQFAHEETRRMMEECERKRSD
ncbi:MAG: tetratricopeptide repeat protein, partial [Desulfobacterales bacterium]|nr:tetratricopeptide repeat protein [Desulfobacterales bacterium]